jgi:hypothetical protein
MRKWFVVSLRERSTSSMVLGVAAGRRIEGKLRSVLTNSRDFARALTLRSDRARGNSLTDGFSGHVQRLAARDEGGSTTSAKAVGLPLG